MTTTADLISKTLNQFAPGMDAPTNAATTATLVAAAVYVERDGKLTPGSRDAIAANRHLIPQEMLRSIAQEAANREEGGARKTLAYLTALGTTFEGALASNVGNASGMTVAPEDISQLLQADEARGKSTMERVLSGLK